METLSAEQNISALLKQVQDKNQEIQDLKQQLAFEIKINAGNQE
jgi:hypothetical protein